MNTQNIEPLAFPDGLLENSTLIIYGPKKLNCLSYISYKYNYGPWDMFIKNLPVNAEILETLDSRKLPIYSFINEYDCHTVVLKCDTEFTLPDKMPALEVLDLFSAQISQLPDHLVVRDFMSISDTKIRTIPCSLNVSRCFLAEDTEIETWPDGACLGGSILFCRSKLTTMPDNLIIDGNLDLSETPIKNLPENLYLRRNLFLKNSQLDEFPSDLQVDGTIYYDFDKAVGILPEEKRGNYRLLRVYEVTLSTYRAEFQHKKS